MLKIKRISEKYLTYSQLSELQRMNINERLWICAAIIVVAMITVSDIFEDSVQGQTAIMIFGDLLYMGAMLALLVYLLRALPLSLKRANLLLTQEVVSKHKDAESWQQKTADIMHGFSKLISRQLNDWCLTDAEKNIAILLLKGLSIKEIAVIRGTSDITVRQQATALYNKAGLNGRAELSAFFLEDLLVVPHQ